MFSELKEEHITENNQIDEFSINFSNEQVRNLSLITGLSFNDVREKVSYIVAGLLNLLTFENRDLRAELENVIKVRSQFVIPDKNFQRFEEGELPEIFFDDASFVLSQLLNKEADEAITEISRVVQIERTVVADIFPYITPIFLNKLSQFFDISAFDFLVDPSTLPKFEIVKNEMQSKSFVDGKSKFANILNPFMAACRKVRSALCSRSQVVFALSVVLLFAFMLLFLAVRQSSPQVTSPASKISSKPTAALAETSTEGKSKNEIVKPLPKTPKNGGKSEIVPMLYPDFPDDSVENQLIPYLTPSERTLPSSIFKINGFKYSNGEIFFSEFLVEDIFYISQFLKTFPAVQIALRADDNKFLSSNRTLQDLYMKSFRDSLVDSGVSKDQIKVQYLMGLEEVRKFKLLNEFSNGVVYFRVIKN